MVCRVDDFKDDEDAHNNNNNYNNNNNNNNSNNNNNNGQVPVLDVRTVTSFRLCYNAFELPLWGFVCAEQM